MVKIFYKECTDGSKNDPFIKKSMAFPDIEKFIEWLFNNEGEYEEINIECIKDKRVLCVHPLRTGSESYKDGKRERKNWFYIKKERHGYGSACHVVDVYRIDVDGKCYLNEDGSGKQVVANSFITQIMEPCIERKKAELDVVYAN